MTYGTHFPVDIVTDILSRLPAKSLVRFRCVCRQWHSFTYDPHFVERHEYHHPTSASKILFFCAKNHNKEIRLHDFETTTMRVTCTSSYELEHRLFPEYEHAWSGPKRIPSGTNNLIMTNFVNGLTCAYNLDERDHVYLLNPFTRDRELVNLPRGPNQLSRGELVSYGFGCDVSNASYKLVRIFRDGRNRGILHGETFALGTREWRYVGKVPDHRVVTGTRPVYVRGTLYWEKTSCGHNIVTFCVDEERFGAISMWSFYSPLVPFSTDIFQRYLHQCGWGGNLYVIVGTLSRPHLTVMAMEDGGGWMKLCDVNASPFLESSNRLCYYFDMIDIEDEKIILATCDYSCNPQILVLCYDTRRRTLSKLYDDRINECRSFDLCAETLRSPRVALIGNGDASK